MDAGIDDLGIGGVHHDVADFPVIFGDAFIDLDPGVPAVHALENPAERSHVQDLII